MQTARIVCSLCVSMLLPSAWAFIGTPGSATSQASPASCDIRTPVTAQNPAEKVQSEISSEPAPGIGRWEQRATASMLSGRSTNSAVWTGDEMIIFGGEGMNVCFGDGACYNPKYDSWRPIYKTDGHGLPMKRTSHSAVWTGKEMIVWGGFSGSYGNNTNLKDGACYNPATNAWRTITAVDAPAARFQHSALWTGSEMLIWGGYTDSNSLYQGATADAALDTGGRYDPETDAWKQITTYNAPSRRLGNAAVWTGKSMIVWGGFDSHRTLGDGSVYDPVTDTWRPMNSEGAPKARVWPVAVWTGTEMVVWGGNRDKEYFRDGARYNPETDTWKPISNINAPRGRILLKGVWTGQGLLFWGGVTDEDATSLNDPTRYLQSGAMYNPTTDTWTPLTTAGAPSGRLASSVWTGAGLIVFGGYNNQHLNDTWFWSITGPHSE